MSFITLSPASHAFALAFFVHYHAAAQARATALLFTEAAEVIRNVRQGRI